MLVIPQGHVRVDARRSPRGNPAGAQRDEDQRGGHEAEHDWDPSR